MKINNNEHNEHSFYLNHINLVLTQSQQEMDLETPFIDSLFKPDDFSIRIPKKDKNTIMKSKKSKILTKNCLQKENFKWERISNILKTYQICKIIKSNDELIDDVLQGNLGDCYFLCALSTLAEVPSRIINLFPQLDSTGKDIKEKLGNGIYKVKCYLNGNEEEIVIDDFFPVNQETNELSFSKIDQKNNNIWPLILEKAWAKVNGSYYNIVEGNISQALEFLSPAPIDIIYHDSSEFQKISKLIKQADENNYLICCDITDKPGNNEYGKLAEMGLLTNHAYSVLEMHEFENIKLLKIRNPWGSFEWNGAWSDSSPFWTPQIREKVNYKISSDNDGFFFMEINDYLKFFNCTYICKIKQGFSYTSTKYEGKKYLELNFTEKQDAFIIVNLKNSKIMNNYLENQSTLTNVLSKEKFKNKFCSIIIFKKDQDNYKYISSISSRSDRIHLELKDAIGKYTIEISFPNSNDNSSVIDSFEKIKTEKDLVDYRFGIYSLKNVEVKEAIFDINIFKSGLLSISQENKEKNYFYQENETTTWRALTFDSNTSSLGVLAYYNDSYSQIVEEIELKEILGLSLIPFDLIPIISEEKVFFDHKSLEDLYEKTKKIESNFYEEKFKEEYKKLKILIPPKSIKIIMIHKYQEHAAISLKSNSYLKFPTHSILLSKINSSSKRMPYKNKEVNVIETVFKHSQGCVFLFSNKTFEFKFDGTLVLEEVLNLEFNELLKDIQSTKITLSKKLDPKSKNKSIISITFTLMPEEVCLLDFRTIKNEGFEFLENLSYKLTFTEEHIKEILNSR